jgi:hypothetical protein
VTFANCPLTAPKANRKNKKGKRVEKKKETSMVSERRS